MGTLLSKSIFPGRIVFILIPVYITFLYYANIANGAYQTFKPDPQTYSLIELEEILGEYKSQLDVLDEQLRDTRKDLEWLIVKISRISDSGRSIPQLLHESVDFKERKISQLERQKKYLNSTAAKYRKIYHIKKNHEENTNQIRIESTPDMKVSVKGVDKSKVVTKLADIEQALKKAGLEDWVDVIPAYGSCAKINNTLPILFSSGSATLAKEYKSFLEKLARFLKPYDVKVYVNGYADPDPIHTPKYPSNLELGASRAANVVHEMVKNGLKPDIFKIGSTGEYQFAAKMQSATKTFQRRAQLTVVFSG
ncbi:OmpA/MotB family protein [Desulfobacter curvatus]|uniref:OmpA/MotB family protein n=1 Tax=Desulfobacter curvatus TaxID=2290 RepID=UPI00035C0DF6|nr:OmpA family protein [Desulfobacter curvatus]